MTNQPGGRITPSIGHHYHAGNTLFGSLSHAVTCFEHHSFQVSHRALTLTNLWQRFPHKVVLVQHKLQSYELSNQLLCWIGTSLSVTLQPQTLHSSILSLVCRACRCLCCCKHTQKGDILICRYGKAFRCICTHAHLSPNGGTELRKALSTCPWNSLTREGTYLVEKDGRRRPAS